MKITVASSEWSILIQKITSNDSSLTELSLKESNLEAQGAWSIANALQRNTSLSKLDLGFNNLGDKGAEAIAAALRTNTSLSKLSLSNNVIGAQGAKAIADALKTNASLSELDLCFNDLGDQGVEAIVDALKINVSLKSVYLELFEEFNIFGLDKHRIGKKQRRVIKHLMNRNKHVLPLLPGLKENTRSTIDLTSKHIGCEGVKALTLALKDNTSLTSLKLEETQLEDEGAKALAVYLKDNSSLKYLILNWNKIGNEGGEALGDALKENTSLTDIQLIGSGIGNKQKEVITNLVKRNRNKAKQAKNNSALPDQKDIAGRTDLQLAQDEKLKDCEKQLKEETHQYAQIVPSLTQEIEKRGFSVNSQTKNDVSSLALNPALKLFKGDGTTISSHLDFQTWYHPDICHYLLQMINNQAQCLHVVFSDSGYDNNTTTFKDQLLTLILLAKSLNKPAIFIGKEPGANNHFICGLVKANNLLLVNPLGITNHEVVYRTLGELQQENIITNVWLSSTILQRGDYEEGLVSCGPISLDIALHVLKNFTLEQLNQFFASLKTNEPIIHNISQCKYFGISIDTLLPENLKKLVASTNVTDYKQELTAIRKRHGEWLAILANHHAKANNMQIADYVNQCKENSLSQTVYNALLTKHVSIINVDELPEYPQLNQKLSQPESQINLQKTKQQDSALSSSEQSLNDYQYAMEVAAQNTRQEFLGLLQSDFQKILNQYKRVGEEHFKLQLQQEQKQYSEFLAVQGQCLQAHSTNCQAVFQEQLVSMLSGQSLETLSEQTLQQVQTQLKAKLGNDFTQKIQDLLNSRQYQDEVQQLQQGILRHIQQRQDEMQLKMVHVQSQQQQIKNEHDPLYKQYQQQQLVLAEQQALLTSEPVRVFYNTIEKVLGSRLMSAMSLASGMIKRGDTKGEKKIAQFGEAAGMVGPLNDVISAVVPHLGEVGVALLDAVPLVGSAASAVIKLGQVGYDIYKGKVQDVKYQNTLSSLIRLEEAGALAELIARRLAQSYQEHINKNCLNKNETEAAGEKAANFVYGLIKAGELKPFDGKPLEDKINYLIQKVQTEAAQQKNGIFTKVAVSTKPVSAQNIQEVTKQIHINELTAEQAKRNSEKAINEVERLRKEILKAYSIKEADEYYQKAKTSFSLREREAITLFALAKEKYKAIKCDPTAISKDKDKAEKRLKKFAENGKYSRTKLVENICALGKK